VEVRFLHLDDAAAARGTVVVIDVLRAFTTAACAFAAGAAELLPVATIEQALDLRAAGRADLAMGEVGGMPVEGFDLSNSPAALDGRRLDGARIAFRTTNGTQGIVRSTGAELVLVASFAVAGATAAALRAAGPALVTMLVTGGGSDRGDEDRACGEYLAALLRDEDPDPAPYLARAAASATAVKFADPTCAWPAEDLPHCLAVDRFASAMAVASDGAAPVIRLSRP
jgi:2-phosphosulfolactate phosphatase